VRIRQQPRKLLGAPSHPPLPAAPELPRNMVARSLYCPSGQRWRTASSGFQCSGSGRQLPTAVLSPAMVATVTAATTVASAKLRAGVHLGGHRLRSQRRMRLRDAPRRPAPALIAAMSGSCKSHWWGARLGAPLIARMPRSLLHPAEVARHSYKSISNRGRRAGRHGPTPCCPGNNPKPGACLPCSFALAAGPQHPRSRRRRSSSGHCHRAM
jgi:hypothetical protein